MSSRHTRSFFGVMLAVVFALSAVVVAPASAKLTKHQKAHIRKQLKRAIKKNPKLIRSKHFIKKASLVNFTLPVTVKLRGSTAASNPNEALIDLGASLGQRTINLGGTLPAEIQFSDSFDGGALGNVKLSILPSGTAGGLRSTSIPLLWNSDVSNVAAGNYLQPPTFTTPSATGSGCSDFHNTGNPANPITGFYPVYNSSDTALESVDPDPAHLPGGPFPGFPNIVGVDDPLALQTTAAVSGTAADDNRLGGTLNPFPSTITGGSPASPTAQDTVLRTNGLKLGVATPGDVDNSTGAPNNAEGSDIIHVGPSGGEANLFGDIPGKDYGIDVTVNLATKINSILRAVDEDSHHLVDGQPWPAYAFNCRQAWTGYVNNYITDVKLQGDLKIAPAITADGNLRIAKATLQTGSYDPARVALAACLYPNTTYANSTVPALARATVAVNVPTPPIDPQHADAAPSVACGSAPTKAVQAATDTGSLNPLNAANTGNAGFTTSADGKKVSVAGDLKVTNISADILIGNTIG